DAGEYKMRFEIPEDMIDDYEFTQPNMGNDPYKNSKANKDGWTETFTLDENNEYLSTDFNAEEIDATEGADLRWGVCVSEMIKQTPIEPATTSVSVEKAWVGEELDEVVIH